MKRRCEGKVALVTGASRGAGRGIAVELGAAGATVVVTGRSTRTDTPEVYGDIMQRSALDSVPGTIEDTAEAVDEAGGRGIAHRCDHTRDEQVRALVDRVLREHGRVDLLVNNAWGGHEVFDAVFDAPFWERDIDEWGAMMDRGVRNHWLASRAVAPAMVEAGTGLIVATTFWDRDRVLKGNLMYDLAKAAINRLAIATAAELGEHGVTSLALSPGWMRTEWILAGHETDEAHWTEKPELARTESPRYLGRAVAALLADPDVFDKTGSVLRVGDLAAEYGFTDIDGRRVPPFELG